MNISIASTDATLEKSIVLGCSLGRANAPEHMLVVWILDDYQAAKRFRSDGEGVSEATKRSLRASYSFDRDSNMQELTWTPDPQNPLSSIKVTLGAPPPLTSVSDMRSFAAVVDEGRRAHN